jgi:hypothetical protein
MKNILLSTAVISALTLSLIGCGSSSSTKKVILDNNSSKSDTSKSDDNQAIVVDNTNTDENIGEKADSQSRAQVIAMKTTNSFSFEDYTISKISGSNSDKFLLISGSIHVKSINTQSGEYPITLMLIDKNNSVITKDFIIKVSADDKQAPIYLLPSSMEAASTFTLNAVNESDTVIYSTNSHDFTINGTILTAPATLGDYNLTVFAEDISGNASKISTQVKVTNATSGGTTGGGTALVFDKVLDKRVDHAAAMHICPSGKRLPTIDELMNNSADLFMATQGLDSDANTPGVKFSSVIWSATMDDSTSSYGVYFVDGTSTNYIKDSFDNNVTYFYTCVPK